MDSNSLNWIKKYHRLTNYLSASMLYLKDNFFLEEDLKPEHIKDRLLGHWGTVPGLNLIYAGLNYLISETNQEILFVAGPGHGAPSIISNLFLEGTLFEYLNEYKISENGIKKLIKDFSWPGGLPSHTYPGIPGTIHEGGELGYSLGVSFGAAFDNPDLLVVCVVGDGEAETGTIAASWQSNKFLNPKTSGSVLPILHLNGYRISGPTLFGTMSKNEIFKYFEGLNYYPIYVDQYASNDVYRDFLISLEEAYSLIKNIKTNWSETEKIKWPIIILKTKKGWSMPEKVNGQFLEDFNKSHGIPLENVKKNLNEFKALEDWLKSYKIRELLDENHEPISEIFNYIPHKEKRIGRNKHAFGGEIKRNLILPSLEAHAIKIKRGEKFESSLTKLSEYIRDLFFLNEENKNFRVFSPDESESNMLEPMFETTDRGYLWPVRDRDNDYSSNGRIMEILSEQVLQTWMQGYNLTGRHGVLISYEAFLGIITSQIDQYVKYIKQSKSFSWRKPLSSVNYVATSTIWRQDHNGFTHQNPVLINSLISKYVDFVSIYFPADANILLATLEDSLKRENAVNLIVADKRDIPQWLSIEEAKIHVKNGLSVWNFASNERNLESEEENVDIVIASAGDHQTKETLAACSILKEIIPELKFKYVNINEITCLGMGDERKPIMKDSDFSKYFTNTRQIIFNFHGYPEVIKQLTWGHEISQRLDILGYKEKGTTTTPFDMQVLNETSRYHVCIKAINYASKVNPEVNKKAFELISHFEEILKKHYKYIKKNGDDMPEVKNFKYNFSF